MALFTVLTERRMRGDDGHISDLDLSLRTCFTRRTPSGAEGLADWFSRRPPLLERVLAPNFLLSVNPYANTG